MPPRLTRASIVAAPPLPANVPTSIGMSYTITPSHHPPQPRAVSAGVGLSKADASKRLVKHGRFMAVQFPLDKQRITPKIKCPDSPPSFAKRFGPVYLCHPTPTSPYPYMIWPRHLFMMYMHMRRVGIMVCVWGSDATL
jgi:hypothetical protein